MRIYLIRHGKTKGNLEGRYIGVTNESLCEQGKNELYWMKEQGKYPQTAYVFQSPLRRCTETTEILFPQAHAFEVADLRECDFGRFENKTYQELSSEESYQRWIDSNGMLPFPAGEDSEVFRRRCADGFEQIAEQILQNKISLAAIVAHGGTIMSILERFAQPKRTFYDWQIKNAMGYAVELSEETWKNEKTIMVLEKIEL